MIKILLSTTLFFSLSFNLFSNGVQVPCRSESIIEELNLEGKFYTISYPLIESKRYCGKEVVFSDEQLRELQVKSLSDIYAISGRLPAKKYKFILMPGPDGKPLMRMAPKKFDGLPDGKKVYHPSLAGINPDTMIAEKVILGGQMWVDHEDEYIEFEVGTGHYGLNLTWQKAHPDHARFMLDTLNHFLSTELSIPSDEYHLYREFEVE